MPSLVPRLPSSLLAVALVACGDERAPAARAAVPDRVASRAGWQVYRHPATGLRLEHPPRFLEGLDDSGLAPCDSATPPADSAVVEAPSNPDEYALTVAMRRGTMAQAAFANGFWLTDTSAATHGIDGSDPHVVRAPGRVVLQGMYWIRHYAEEGGLLGQEPTLRTFAAVERPGGCLLAWAANGRELHADTLAAVLATARFER